MSRYDRVIRCLLLGSCLGLAGSAGFAVGVEVERADKTPPATVTVTTVEGCGLSSIGPVIIGPRGQVLGGSDTTPAPTPCP